MSVTHADQLSPMPTPHSRRLHRRGPRVALVTMLLLIGPFLLLELGVRGLIATGRLPTSPSHSEQLDVGLVQVRALPPQNVLFMGDSQFATGLEPEVLENLLEKALGREVPLYDFAQPASTTTVNRKLLEMLAAEGRMPKVVLMDISMSSLIPELVPHLPGVPREPVLIDEAGRPTFFDSALGAELVGCGLQREIVDRLDCELGRISAAWRWHGRPDRLARAVISGPGLQAKEARGRLRKDGFFARTPAKPGYIERQLATADYAQNRFHPQFNQSEANDFKAFADFIESQGSHVIFVQVPLTPMYTSVLESQNPGWQAERRAAVEGLEAYVGRDIVLVEDYGDWWDDESASDLNHLSAEAAKHFTRQLWDMPDFREPLLAALGGAPASPAASPGPAASPSPAVVPSQAASPAPG